MAYSYHVPSKTNTILQQRRSVCQNFGLTLSRYVPKQAVEETAHYDEQGKEDGKERSHWLKQICATYKPDVDLITGSYERWIDVTQNATRFILDTRGRLLVGLGGKGALEFGMTLHRATGLPYIPGSALKGLARSYALLTIAESRNGEVTIQSRKEYVAYAKWINELDKELIGEKYYPYYSIFGSQDDAGGCIFYDAVIANTRADTTLGETSLFVADILNPHYPEYYTTEGVHPPSDDGQDPIPFIFPAIREGVHFAFAVGVRQGSSPELAAQAVTWLRDGLTQMGVGAKTAAGYGIFTASRSPDYRQVQRVKTGFEVGDEISGKVTDTDGGLLFEIDENPYPNPDEIEYYGFIPKNHIVKQRQEGEVVKGRIIGIKPDGELTCEQIADTGKGR